MTKVEATIGVRDDGGLDTPTRPTAVHPKDERGGAAHHAAQASDTVIVGLRSADRNGHARLSAPVSRRTALRAGLGVAASALGAGLWAAPAMAMARSSVVSGTRVRFASSVAGGGTVTMQWTAALLQAVRDTHPVPTVTSRAFAILHTCIFDAWAAYDPIAVGTRLGGAARRPVAEHTIPNKAAALSYAAYTALADLFPSQAPLFAATLAGLGYDPTVVTLDPGTPPGVGRAAALAVLAFRHHDGSNQLGDLHPGAYADYTGYRPVDAPHYISPRHLVDPNHWQPLRVPDGHGGYTVQQFTTPHWGRVVPFALTSGDQLRPADGPALYPSDRYRRQALEILALSAGLTDEQKVIAEYWADGPNSELPPGHWFLFAGHASQRDNNSLDTDVKMCFALGNALLDAGIACWDAKRAYDSIRPISAIHDVFGGRQVSAWVGPGRGTQAIDGASWQPYQPLTVVTPPFAEFTSGHSTFSAAAAEILKHCTGSDACGMAYTQPAGVSRVEPGLTPARDVTLSWATFSAAADQAGLSRRYGGIHFKDGDEAGRRMGRQIGRQVWARAQTYVNGTAPMPTGA